MLLTKKLLFEWFLQRGADGGRLDPSQPQSQEAQEASGPLRDCEKVAAL